MYNRIIVFVLISLSYSLGNSSIDSAFNEKNRGTHYTFEINSPGASYVELGVGFRAGININGFLVNLGYGVISPIMAISYSNTLLPMLRIGYSFGRHAFCTGITPSVDHSDEEDEEEDASIDQNYLFVPLDYHHDLGRPNAWGYQIGVMLILKNNQDIAFNMVIPEIALNYNF